MSGRAHRRMFYESRMLEYRRCLPSLLSRLGAPSGRGVVCPEIWHADRAPGAGLAAHPGRAHDAHLRPHRFGQDPGCVSGLHRSPGAQGAGRRPARPHRSALRLAAEGAGQRHSEKSRSAAGRDSSDGGRARPADAGDSHRRPHRRHADARAPGDAEAAAAHSGHHAGVALHSADRGEESRDSARCRDRHRRRNPRRRRRQARRASGAVAGAAGSADASSAGAHRTLGDPEAD